MWLQLVHEMRHNLASRKGTLLSTRELSVHCAFHMFSFANIECAAICMVSLVFKTHFGFRIARVRR